MRPGYEGHTLELGMGSGFWVWGREGMDEWRKRMKILKAHDLRYGAGSLGLEM